MGFVFKIIVGVGYVPGLYGRGKDRIQIQNTSEIVALPLMQNPTEAQRKEHDKYEFELNDVYAVDVLISTGEAS
jgi:hypothetical protein